MFKNERRFQEHVYQMKKEQNQRIVARVQLASEFQSHRNPVGDMLAREMLDSRELLLMGDQSNSLLAMWL